MAVKDLAIFKLFSSVFKKDKVEEREPEATLISAKGHQKSPKATMSELIKSSSEKEDDDAPKAVKKYETAPANPTSESEFTSLKKDNEKKIDTTTKSIVKTSSKNSSKTTTKSKREQKLELYLKDIKKHCQVVDREFLEVIVKNLGPSIYRKDAETVSCSDERELDTVRRNFLIKKLGFDKTQKDMLDDEIQKVCQSLKGVKKKYRATFYYILAKNLKKESALS